MINRIIAVSTASVDNEHLLDYIKELEFAKADRLHADVMDGTVVRRATFDNNGLKVILQNTTLPTDVHLQIYQPHKQIKKYIALKPNSIIVQYDHFSYERQLRKTLMKIQRKGIKSGLALSPNIPISYILPFVPYIDELLILGLEPDSEGGKMFEGAYDKIKNAVDLKTRFKKDLVIQFKGGVTFENVESLYKAGVNVVVAEDVVYSCFSKSYAIDNIKKPNSNLITSKSV